MHQADVINGISDVFYTAEHRVDICGNSRFPSLIFSFESIRNAVIAAKNRGIEQRYILEITKENISYCKQLLKMVGNWQIHHSEDIEANFVLNETEYLSSITIREPQQAIFSNVREIIEQERSIFDIIWSKSMPAKHRIRQIQEGLGSEFLEVIYDTQRARDIYIDLAKSVKNEALVLFANSKAIIRADRLGVVDSLIRAAKEDALVKIICPINEENSQLIRQISEDAPNIKILNGGQSHSGLFIVDNTKFIRFELKEIGAEDFTDAIGFILYSNTKVSVYSSRSFFELLWNDRIQYEKLKETDEMKSKFINVAAHELRTPIQPILSLSELMRSEIKGSRHQESLNVIVRNAKRLQRLTENILDVTKIESRSLDLKQEQFNLNDIITNILNDTIILTEGSYDNKNNNSNKKTNIRLQYRPQDVFVEGDESRISQVIYNLVNNAIKFSREGTIIISVDTKIVDNKIIVSVKDTGSGIDREILPELFSKFTAKSFSGTGLGLFISKKIIEAHGGKIWAENNTDGKGATFTFMLPMIREVDK